MDAGALHTDTGADGVDAVVVRLNGDFGALAGFADDFLDGDEAVVNLGHFSFEEALQEDLGGT